MSQLQFQDTAAASKAKTTKKDSQLNQQRSLFQASRNRGPWWYLSKDNLTVPLQRQPNSTSTKTTWQYLVEDDLTVPLQRQPDATSLKTTWQYLSKDNLTVPLQRQPDSTSSKTT